MEYLITTNEVISAAPAGHNFDPKLLEAFVFDACEDLRNNDCFGVEFYLDIFGDMVTATQYDACKVYQIGDIVIYGAKYYECTAVTTAGILPTNILFFALTNKFTTAAYQTLWDNYLLQYLTFSVLGYAVPSIAFRATTMGIMRNNTDHSESADEKTVFSLKNDWQNRKDLRWNSMFKFLTFVNTSGTINNVLLYPLFPANAETLCCNTCKPCENPINIPFLGC